MSGRGKKSSCLLNARVDWIPLPAGSPVFYIFLLYLFSSYPQLTTSKGTLALTKKARENRYSALRVV